MPFDIGPVCVKSPCQGKSGLPYVFILDSDITVRQNSSGPFVHLAGVLICSLSEKELFERRRGEGNSHNKKAPHQFSKCTNMKM